MLAESRPDALAANVAPPVEVLDGPPPEPDLSRLLTVNLSIDLSPFVTAMEQVLEMLQPLVDIANTLFGGGRYGPGRSTWEERNQVLLMAQRATPESFARQYAKQRANVRRRVRSRR